MERVYVPSQEISEMFQIHQQGRIPRYIPLKW